MTKQYKQTLFDKLKAVAVKWVFGDPEGGTGGVYQVASSTQIAGNKGSLGNSFDSWVNEAYEQNETVCGAINLIISTFCEAELKVVDEDMNHLDQSNTQKLLDFVNEDLTTRQLLSTILMHMYFGGCAFLEKLRDRRGRITGLAPIRPDRMTLHVTPELGLSHYVFSNGTSEVRLEKEDILWIPFISPRSPYESFSPLWALARTVNSDNSAKSHSENTLANGGRPGSLITTDQEMDPEHASMMAKAWDNAFKGKNNGTTGVLWGGAKYETLGYSMKDLDFTALREVDEAKVLSTLRIPLAVYGSITGSKSSTYNNVLEAKKQFWEQCIIPLQTNLLDVLNDDEELSLDGEIIFDRSQIKALQEDHAEIATRAKTLYQYPGIITLNEAREMIGLEAIDGGDELNQPQSLGFGLNDQPQQDNTKSTYDRFLSDPEQKRLFDMEYGELLKESLKEALEDSKKRNEVEYEAAFPQGVNIIKAALEEATENGKKSAHGSATANPPSEARELDAAAIKKKTTEDVQKQITTILGREAVAKKFLRKTKAMAVNQFDRQISDVMKIVGETKSHKAFKQFEKNRVIKQLEELLFGWQVAAQEDSEGVLNQLMVEAGLHAAGELGKDIVLTDTEALAYMRTYTHKFAKKLTDTSYKQLKNTLEDAYTNGLNIQQTSKQIQLLGDQWDKNRATMIARTETSRAANAGARIGYQKAGVTKLVFSAILDGATSEICQALNGTVVGVNDPFIEEGEGFPGTNLDYTNGGIQEPPCHPNCRSAILPVIE